MPQTAQGRLNSLQVPHESQLPSHLLPAAHPDSALLMLLGFRLAFATLFLFTSSRGYFVQLYIVLGVHFYSNHISPFPFSSYQVLLKCKLSVTIMEMKWWQNQELQFWGSLHGLVAFESELLNCWYLKILGHSVPWTLCVSVYRNGSVDLLGLQRNMRLGLLESSHLMNMRHETQWPQCRIQNEGDTETQCRGRASWW